MAATNDPDLTGYTVPSAVPTDPYPPSPVEAKFYYYGIPSRPRLVARSSANVWVEPTGIEPYLTPKELAPLGFKHPLRAVWDDTVGPAMVAYLDSKGVKWTSLDPVRMGEAGESSPPAIIWIGVVPGSLSAQDGVEVATHCKTLLTAHSIDDVHVEIRESEVICSAKMYQPAFTSEPTAQAQEPFTTALGLPICAEGNPSIEGTGGFFISDPRYPGKIYLVTARHVVFHPDNDSNELYQHRYVGQRRRNVLLFGDAAFKKQIKEIESEISGKYIIIKQLEGRLKYAEQMDEVPGAKAEQKHARSQLEQAKKAIGALETFLADVSRDWKRREDRVLGYVVLSPPIGLNVEEGFTEDWAVIEIDASTINSTNFIGNAIDLGTSIPVDEFTTWTYPHPDKPSSFEYPGDRLLKFHGTIPDEEMWKPDSRTLDHDNDACIMVIKRGYASDLTVGRLNMIRSFTRVYFKDERDQRSKEVAVLPRNYQSGAFSIPGDSGSAVVDGKGRVAGLLTSGAGVTDVSDCTYLTSINFLVKRMLEYGLQANLSPSLDA